MSDTFLRIPESVVNAKREPVDPASDEIFFVFGEAEKATLVNSYNDKSISLDASKKDINPSSDISPSSHSVKTQNQSWNDSERHSYISKKNEQCLEATEEDASIENSPCLDPPAKDEQSNNANAILDTPGIPDNDPCLEPPEVNALIVHDDGHVNIALDVPVQLPVLENEKEDSLPDVDQSDDDDDDDDIFEENPLLKSQFNDNPTNICSPNSPVENDDDDLADVNDDNHSVVSVNVSNDKLVLPDVSEKNSFSVDGLTIADLLRTSQACLEEPNNSLSITDLLSTSQACDKERLPNSLSNSTSENEKQMPVSPLSNLNVQKEKVVSGISDSSIASPTVQTVKRISHNLGKCNVTLLNWNCKTCGHNAKTKKELISHIYDEHLRDDYEMKIKCDSCEFECDTQSELEEHNLSHEVTDTRTTESTIPIAQKSAPILRVVLQDCLLTPTKSVVRQNNKDDEILVISDEEDDLPIRKNNNRVKCFLCNYETDTEQSLRDHVKRHGGMRYYCDNHFWLNALANCRKCVFEKIMSSLRQLKSIENERFTVKRSKIDKSQNDFAPVENQNVEQNLILTTRESFSNKENFPLKISDSISPTNEDQDPECLEQLVQDPVSTAAASPNKENSSKNVSDAIQNITDNENEILTSSSKQNSLLSISEAQNVISTKGGDQNRENKSLECSIQPIQDLALAMGVSLSRDNSTKDILGNPENGNQNKDSCKDNQSFECSVQPVLTEGTCLSKDAARVNDLDLENDGQKSSGDKENTDGVQIIQNLLLTANSSLNKEVSSISAVQNDTSPRSSEKNKNYKENVNSECSIQLPQKSASSVESLQNKVLSVTDTDNIENTTSSVQNSREISANKRKNRDESDSQTDESHDFPLPFKCFDCNEVISKKEELKRHALSNHPESSFKCDQHSSNTNFYECDKCVYELIFKTCLVKIVDNDDDPLDMEAAVKDSKKRRFSKQPQRRSRYKEPRTNVIHDTSSSSDSDDLNSTSVGIRRTRASQAKQKSQNKAVSSDDSDGDVDSGDPVNKTETTDIAAKCFDCKYVTKGKMWGFKKHAFRHLGSKFQCVQHWNRWKCWDNLIENCLKCRYEALLQTFSRNVIYCRFCDYKTFRKIEMDRHLASQRGCCNRGAGHYRNLSQKEIICFECHYVTTRKELLKYHMVDHLDREFVCKKHLDGRKKDCLECIHEESLKNARRELLRCRECGFKTVNKDIFNVHGCIVEIADEIAKKYTCYDCDKFNTDALEELRDHAVLHDSSSFQCSDHSSGTVVDDCPKCIYQNVVRNLKNSARNEKYVMPSLTESDKTKRSSNQRDSFHEETGSIEGYIKAKCFDCNYVIRKHGNIRAFKSHICCHIGSKYRCLKHLNETNDACLKCYYETSLRTFNRQIFFCNNCGYRTIERLRIARHLSGTQSCQIATKTRIDSLKIMCFECNYVTRHVLLLKYHMVDHLDRDFRCDKHTGIKGEECPGCVNEKCLEEAKNEAMTCYKCNFKTAIAEVFAAHKCEPYFESKPKITYDAEGGHGIISFYEFSTKSDRTLILECFDCDYSIEESRYGEFKRHVFRHMGSKYWCMEHWTAKNNECPKCRYETVLAKFRDKVFFCKNCDYRTLDRRNLNRHQASPESCNMWKSIRPYKKGTLECFRCPYVTKHKNLLKYHLVDHLDHEYACPSHSAAKQDSCLRCTYQKCLQGAKKEVLICEKCEFKSVIEQVFDRHECTLKETPTVTEVCDIDVDVEAENVDNNSEATRGIELARSQHPLAEISAKCFDCKYFSADRVFDFRKHVVRHIGSKYQCMEHWQTKNTECLKCYYEAELKNLQRYVKCCETCGFKTLLEADFDKHARMQCCKYRESKNSLAPGELMCFNCFYVTTRKKFLKYHAVDHLDHEFACKKHLDGKYDNCAECIYEQCLESANKEALICRKCEFKTVIQQVFDRHGCSAQVCELEKEDSDVCIVETENTDNNVKSDGKTIQDEQSKEEHDSTNQTSDINAQCFDCNYSSADGASSFRKHIIRHFGSKYQCMEHSKVKHKDCSKCYYELELKNLPSYVKCCENCGYKSFGLLDLQNHLKELACRNWQYTKDLKPGEMVCFKCNYITTQKKYLKYHVVDHLDHTFSCSEHPKKKNENCLECIYEQCIENARQEVLKCKTCEFKTTVKQIFESHNCSSAAGECRAEKESNKRLKTLTKAEQSVAIKKSRGEKEIRVRCFDCKFSTTDKNNIFRKHIVRHLGSKYKCMEHLKVKNNECLKCLYELELQNIQHCVKYCKTCAFKTVHPQELHAHIKENACKDWQDDYKLLPGEIICLKCRYVTTHKKFLKYHLVDHLDHEFSCGKHPDTKNSTCSGCIYEHLLGSAKREALVCKKCEFKSTIQQIFKTHGCSEVTKSSKEVSSNPEDSDCVIIEENTEEVINKTGPVLSCFDCNEFVADTVEELRKHVILHPQSKVQCDKHSSGNAFKDCSKCIYQNLINTYQSNNDGNDAAKTQNISDSSQGDISIVDSTQKCFDCKYSSAHSRAFRTHVCRHLGSKFQCMEHWKNKNGDCLKCRYEDLLQNLQKEVKCCKICHYRAMDALSLTRHVEDEGSCRRWADRCLEPGEIRCVECQYVTTRNKFLKYHMADHLDLTLSCDIHGENKNEKCEKCINKECLERAKKEALICEKCTFATLIKQIFETHACNDNAENLLEGGQVEKVSKDLTTEENNINNEGAISDAHDVLAELKSNDVSKNNDNDEVDKQNVQIEKENNDTQIIAKDNMAAGVSETNPGGKDSNSLSIEENMASGTDHALKNSIIGKLEDSGTMNIDRIHTKSDTRSTGDNAGNKQAFQTAKDSTTEDGNIEEAEIENTIGNDVNDELEAGEAKIKEHTREAGNNEDSVEGIIGGTLTEPRDTEHISKNNINIACKLKDVAECSTSEPVSNNGPGRKDGDGLTMENIVNDDLTQDEISKVGIEEPFESDEEEEDNIDATLESQDSDDILKTYYSPNTVIKAECFDCSFTTNHSSRFREHICRHLGSKFQCIDHPETKYKNCFKCQYEKVLENVGKTVKTCKQCGYKSLDQCKFNRHKKRRKSCRMMQNRHLQPGEIKCQECSYTTMKIHLLKYHMVDHLDRNISCQKHRDTRNGKCRECVNERCLDRAKKEVKICEKCNFKSVIKEVFELHKCSRLTGDKVRKYRCFDCEKFVADTKDELRNHSVSHYKSVFKCSQHRAGVAVEDCPQCIYQNIVISLEDATVLIPNKSLFYKCFDCSVTYERVSALTNHAVNHIGSTFTCDDHEEGQTRSDCAKCVYVEIVKNIGNNTFTCRNCGFKSYTWARLKAHEKNKGHCQEFKAQLLLQGKSLEVRPPKLYQCLECEFIHERKDFFMKHLDVHADSTFQCDEHDDYFDQCVKCEYCELLDQLGKRLSRQCFDCNPRKTFSASWNLKRHIVRKHKDSFYVCKKHVVNKLKSCAKCVYERTVQEVNQDAFRIVCCECACDDFENKEQLKDHIKKFHSESSFGCHVHPSVRESDKCYRCLYEELTQVCADEASAARFVASTSKDVWSTYQCYNCEFQASCKAAFSTHIRENHLESKFSCTEHSLGDIDCDKCPMCRYENILVTTKLDSAL